MNAARIRYVRMPKTASNTVANWMIERAYNHPEGHIPAREVLQRHPDAWLFGTVRHPFAWYRSWYAHCMRGGPDNWRTMETLKAYGRGSTAWRDVVYGLTHPKECPPFPGDLSKRDHLLNPAGGHLFEQEGGLWSRSIRWFFMDEEDRWLVKRLIHLHALSDGLSEVFGVDAGDVEHRNAAGPEASGLAWDAEMEGWAHDADGAMYFRRVLGEMGAYPFGLGVVRWG